MVRLSLCMIVKNEERMLPGCLASVRGVVDEIVVVDTGSADSTVALAGAAGAKVVMHPWSDDFAAPRNTALRHATGDYVLVLDADERLAPGAGPKIRKAIARKDFDCGMLRLHDALRTDALSAEVLSGNARHGDPVRVPRVLRRTPDLEFTGIIHESVTPWLIRRGRNLRFLDADIVHLGGAPELRAQLRKSERNIALLRRRAEIEPEEQLVQGFLAHELLNAGRPAEAWEAVEKGWAHIHRCDTAKGESILRLATARARILLESGDPDGVLATVTRAAEIEGEHPDLDFLRGAAYEMAAGSAGSSAARAWRLEASEAAYRAALGRRDTAYVQNFVVGATSWAAHTRIGTVCLLRGLPAAARAAFENALGLRADHREAAFGRVEALLDAGDGAGALHHVEKLLGDEPDGWLLAAAAADGLGALDDMKLFLAQARTRVDRGFVAAHRAARHGGLLVALASYMGRPVAGPGTVGSMGALLAGAPLPEASEGRPPDPMSAVRFAMNLVRVGRALALGRLVGPRAEAVLPGLGDIVRQVAVATDVTLVEPPTPLAVWLDAAPGPRADLVAAVLAAHPGITLVPERVAAVRVVRLVSASTQTPAGAPAVSYEALLAEPRAEVERLVAALGLPRAPTMLRVLVERYPGALDSSPPSPAHPRNDTCSGTVTGDRHPAGSRPVHTDTAHEVHA